ncbi:hypothetical protein [Subtercola sp. YIM 133946]|uniref:hypothetical protein n=1 Tax=Subtercola sp. YIM 133946 TaxID=3118909 RepID=UPI002F95897B
MFKLRNVFGISANVGSPSYVDRGGLDKLFERALVSDRHIAVHGGSKQGKSWLRARGLPDDQTLLVQCTPSSTPASLLAEALGRLGVSATLSTTKSKEISGSLDFRAAIELGKLIAKAKAEGHGSVQGSLESTTELEPVGQTSADLLWVALTIRESGRRLVLEDFHYLSQDAQSEFAFMLKAMGEYGLFVVVVGVWPRDHLLSYFNGDLDGRIVDIHLMWSNAELTRVVSQGSSALNVMISNQIEQQMVRDAYGSVGLLQRLAEGYLLAEGVTAATSGSRQRQLTGGTNYLLAREEVANQMQGRYQTFADNFVRGMRRLPEGLEVYKHILQTATEATDDELIDGIDSAILLQRVLDHEGADAIRASDLTQALDRIDRLQMKIGVNPVVLTYNRSDRKLFLADRSFLFYRQHSSQTWPWSQGEPEIVNDLYIQEPLNFDFDLEE